MLEIPFCGAELARDRERSARQQVARGSTGVSVDLQTSMLLLRGAFTFPSVFREFSAVKIRFSSGGEETGIVNQTFARALSVLTGFRMRSFRDEAEASEFLRNFLDSPPSSGEKDDEWVRQLARRLVSGKLAVVSRTRSAPAFIHPRPIEASPLQDEEALRQRDPEPVPPPPPVTLVEPMVVTPEQLRTDAPLCEL